MAEKLSSGPKVGHDLTRVSAGLTRGPNRKKSNNAAAWSGTWPAPGATLDLDFANDRGFVRGVGQGRSMDAVTFTRASSANWVDSTGVMRTGAGTFTGTANALGNNLLTFPQDFDNAAWNKSASAVTGNVAIAPDGTTTSDKLIPNTTNSSHWVGQTTSFVGVGTLSFYAKAAEYSYCSLANSQNNWVHFDLTTGAVSTLGTGWGSASCTDAGNGWWRCSATNATSQTWSQFFIYALNSWLSSGNSSPAFVGDGTSSIYIWGAQLETGSSATTYYPTNINVPRFDWASTASTGSGTLASPYVIPLAANTTCNGLLIEESRTNRLLWCRDATNAAWTKTNVTAAKDQTGIDGVASAASSLTASADAGTCIQTVTLASGSRTGSVYLKRITGTGNVQVSLDGSTWSTVDLSSTEWRRIVLSGTVTNPTIGIRLATNGDAVAMDYGQIEDGAFATSPILTTTATVTRSADSATMTGQNFSGWYKPDVGTLYSEFQNKTITSASYILSIQNGLNNPQSITFYATSATAINVYSYNVSPQVNITNTIVSGAFNKIIGTYKVDDFASCANGSTIGLDNSATLGTSTLFYIGREVNTISTCLFKRIIYYPSRLNNNVLQIISGGAT